MNTITLRDMASIIAKAETRPEEKVFNQLKGLAGRNILSALPDFYGKKGALLFRPKEIYRARMLLAALDNGFAADALATFDAQLRSESREVFANGTHVERSLEKAVAALGDENQAWQFQVGQQRINGKLAYSGHWTINGRHSEATHDWLSQPPEGYEFDYAGSLESVVTLMFTNICRPIFDEVARRENTESPE